MNGTTGYVPVLFSPSVEDLIVGLGQRVGLGLRPKPRWVSTERGLWTRYPDEPWRFTRGA